MLEFGYIKLYRSILNWEWYDDIKTKTLFLHLLLTVNYYDAGWHGLTIKKGQRMCSIATLSLETKLTVQEVRTAMKRLKSTGEITCETSRGCTLITIKNFERYQQDKSMPADKQQSEGAFPTDEQHASNKALTTEQQAANTEITSNQHASNKASTTEQQQSKKARKQELYINTCSELEPSSKPVFSLPCIGDKCVFEITQGMIERWTELYPAVDVMQDLRAMLGWLEANARQKKTHDGMPRFINRWLSKTQNRGGNNRQPTYKQKTKNISAQTGESSLDKEELHELLHSQFTT